MRDSSLSRVPTAGRNERPCSVRRRQTPLLTLRRLREGACGGRLLGLGRLRVREHLARGRGRLRAGLSRVLCHCGLLRTGDCYGPARPCRLRLPHHADCPSGGCRLRPSSVDEGRRRLRTLRASLAGRPRIEPWPLGTAPVLGRAAGDRESQRCKYPQVRVWAPVHRTRKRCRRAPVDSAVDNLGISRRVVVNILGTRHTPFAPRRTKRGSESVDKNNFASRGSQCRLWRGFSSGLLPGGRHLLQRVTMPDRSTRPSFAAVPGCFDVGTAVSRPSARTPQAGVRVHRSCAG